MATLSERIAAGSAVDVIAFMLGGEHFAVDILAVDEVVSGGRIHPLPDVPPVLLGVLLLRGDAIPVVDVAASLHVPPTRAVEDVLILEHNGRRIGIATEGVLGTRSFVPGAVRPAPREDSAARPLLGVVPVEDGLCILIDPYPLIPLQGPLP